MKHKLCDCEMSASSRCHTLILQSHWQSEMSPTFKLFSGYYLSDPLWNTGFRENVFMRHVHGGLLQYGAVSEPRW